MEDTITICKCLSCKKLYKDLEGNTDGVRLPNKYFPKHIQSLHPNTGCPICEDWEGVIECTEILTIRRYKKELADKDIALTYPQAIYFKSKGPYNYQYIN